MRSVMGYDAAAVIHSSKDNRKTKDCKPYDGRILYSAESGVTEPTAGAVLDRMHQLLGLRTDIALAEYFGLGKSTVGGWRKHNRIPLSECLILAKRKGASLDWLLLGIGPQAAPEPAVKDVVDGTASYADPRVTRLVRFVSAWQATHDDDDMAWLERSIARAIPEYGEWLAGQPKGKD